MGGETPMQYKYNVPPLVFKRSAAKSFYTLDAAIKYVRDNVPQTHITTYWRSDWSTYLAWIVQEIPQVA